MSEDFYNAAVSGEIDRVRDLLARDPSLLRSTDKWGFTALHGVAGEEHYEIASLLLDAGADPNAKNDEGITPLHLAAYPEMVELLIRRGALVDARSNDGSTPLIVQAAEAEGLDVMRALLRLGADPKTTDKAGSTALDIARARDETEKVEMLESLQARSSKPWWKIW